MFNFYVLVGVVFFFNLIFVIVCLLYKIRSINLLSASLMYDFMQDAYEKRVHSQHKEGDCSSCREWHEKILLSWRCWKY